MEVLVKMKKVLFVATVVKTHIMEFHIPYLKMFKDLGWETAVAARNDYENPKECIIPYCDTYYNVNFERFPLKPSNITAYRQLRKIINENEYDIVHCHTPVGGVLGRLAASQIRKKGAKVIYTAHGFHFFTGASALNWAIYYPIERIMARYTDALITINKEDYERAKHFKAKEICYIPGVGVNTEKFSQDTGDALLLRKQLGIPLDAMMLLSVGELNKNKNHKVIIETLARFKGQNIYYVICGKGPLLEDYQGLATSLGIEKQVILTGYRTDVEKFYQIADVFIFPSYREGLPVSVMEAMISGLPVICSDIRGSRDLVMDSDNIMVSDPDDQNAYAHAIEKLKDVVVRDRIGVKNKERSKQYFLNTILKKYREIYKI